MAVPAAPETRPDRLTDPGCAAADGAAIMTRAMPATSRSTRGALGLTGGMGVLRAISTARLFPVASPDAETAHEMAGWPKALRRTSGSTTATAGPLSSRCDKEGRRQGEVRGTAGQVDYNGHDCRRLDVVDKSKVTCARERGAGRAEGRGGPSAYAAGRARRFDQTELRAELRRRLRDWRGLLLRNVPETRALLRLMLPEPIIFTPDVAGERRGHRYGARAHVGGLLSGVIDPTSVAFRVGIRCPKPEDRWGQPIRIAELASPGGSDDVYEVPAVAWFAA